MTALQANRVASLERFQSDARQGDTRLIRTTAVIVGIGVTILGFLTAIFV